MNMEGEIMPFAQNMYIDWNQSGTSFDLVIKSWFCSVNSHATYWAVHQWSNGYAGFQNISDNTATENNVIILAVWDDDSYLAEVEYYTSLANTSDFDFVEGRHGKHIISSINWQDNTWYSMAVGVKSDSDATYYFQWVKEEVDNNWTLYSIIRLPLGGRTLNKSSVFQEDYASTNLLRQCRISNAYGRQATTGTWGNWNTGVIKSLNPNTGEWNTRNNCNCGLGTYPEGEYVYLSTGDGAGTCSKRLPHSFELEYSGNIPMYSPTFPYYIKSNFSNLHISPDSTGTKVVQKSSRYWWNFVRSSDGYVYILTTDKTKAITISGVNNGDNLILSPFSINSNTQKWRINENFGVVYLSPKNALTKNIDIEGPSTLEDAELQIWTHNTTTQQFKWTIV